MKSEFKAFVSKVLSNREYKKTKKQFIRFLDGKDQFALRSVYYFLTIDLDTFEFNINSEHNITYNSYVLQKATLNPLKSKDKYTIEDCF